MVWFLLFVLNEKKVYVVFFKFIYILYVNLNLLFGFLDIVVVLY